MLYNDNQINEIEIKARVYNKLALLDFLHENAKFNRKYFKKDFYYAKDEIDFNINECIRMRLDRGGYTFTSKNRSLDNGVEFNIERNFSCTKHKSKVIITFIKNVLGMSLYVYKEKKGRAFIYKNTLIEVSNIKGLGDYIEIELLDNVKIDISDRAKFLKDILFELSIDEKDIETRAYIDLLKDK